MGPFHRSGGTLPTLDEALEELYGVDGAAFVSTRKELVARLRAAGDVDGARAVARARRPTTAAWALNRLVREERAAVEDLLDRGRELRDVQTGDGTIDADALRAASARRRESLAAAVEAAERVAARSDVSLGAHRDAVTATLDAASIDEQLGAQLLTGRLEREASGPVGFPATAAAPAPRAGPRPHQPSRNATGRRAAPEVEPAPAPDLEVEAVAATERATSARAHAGELMAAVEEHEREVERIGVELEEAHARLRDARNAAHRAAAEARDLERRAERARRALD